MGSENRGLGAWARRFEIYPTTLAAAGGAGGALGIFGEGAITDAFIGGGIGLGIGAALAASKRWWVGLLAVPALGILGLVAAAIVYRLVSQRELPEFTLRDIMTDRFAVYLAFVAAPVLTLAHHLFLCMRQAGLTALHGVWLYAVMGALSCLLFWSMLEPVRHVVPGALLKGAVYGLLQFLGILTARAIERRWRLPDGTRDS